MSLTDPPAPDEQARADALATNPTLLPRTANPPQDAPAEQGPPPADYATRPQPPVPTPSADGLSADEVTRLTGGEDTTEVNRELEAAEGVSPDVDEG